MRLAIAALVLLFLPGLASAQVYKCVDKEGRVKYVQTKPKDTDCGGVQKPAAPAPATDGADPLKNFGAEVDKSRAADAEVRKRNEQAEAQKRARCAQAQARLAALERASHVFTTDEQGERHYQTAQQNDAMREEARQSVALHCG